MINQRIKKNSRQTRLVTPRTEVLFGQCGEQIDPPFKPIRLSRLLFVLSLALANSVSSAATVTYVYSDAQGTPLAEADSSGNVIAMYDYKPYGSSYAGSGMSTPVDGIGYSGHIDDVDTTFVYMQARYYDPSIGRFISIDPSPVQDGGLWKFGRYGFADSNPIVNSDPNGRDTEVSMMFHETAVFMGMGYNHEFVSMRDTDTGKVYVARGGPSGEYPLINGLFNLKADQNGFIPLTGQKPMTLQTYVGPLSSSAEAGFANKTLAGSQVTLAEPFQDVINEATEISNAVNASQIPYQPQSTNSNAFANATYQKLTGKVPPDQENASGSSTKLPINPLPKKVAPPANGGGGGGSGSGPTAVLCHIHC